MAASDTRTDALSEAVSLHRNGQLASAIEAYRGLLADDPANHDARLNLGAALVASGDFEQAEKAYRTVLAAAPANAAAHYNYGNLCRDRGNRKAAEQHYLAALHADPRNIGTMVNLSQLFTDSNRIEEARRLLARAVRLAPASHICWNALAIVHMNAGRLNAAATCFRRALAHKPDYATSLTNLGSCYRMMGRLDEALSSHRAAVALEPDNAKAQTNLGVTQVEFNDLNQALMSYNQALKIDPGSIAARFNRGIARLLSGDFEQGFRDYSARWQRPDIPALGDGAPFWEGEDLKGKRLLLFSEQGYGDSLQFVRYAPMLEQRGAVVILHCQTALVRLLSGAPGISKAVPRNTAPPPHDLRVALLELPRLLGTTLENIPCAEGYLPRPVTPDHKTERLRVGLVWAGSPTHKNDSKRSCRLTDLLSLFELPDIDLFSLQFGDAAKQLGMSESVLIQNSAADCQDFQDTALVIAGLDLVITVDTSVAHLAGALGIKVWVMLPHAPDWRWMLERNDSPWYRTMTLYRQDNPDDGWSPVVQHIGNDLAKLAEKHGAAVR